jgi:hypothetical protein
LNSLVQSFNLLNAFTTIITNVDTNNKKLFAFSNTYRTNALVDKSIEVDGHGPASIYKNGLAMPLPLVIVSGLSTGADDTDLLLAKTNYSVAVKAANHVAETTGLTQYFGNDNK